MFQIDFSITRDSLIVGGIFMAFMLVLYIGQAIVGLFTKEKIKGRWWLITIFFGLVGFALGSIGAAPFIYGMVDMAMSIFGAIKINIH